MSGKRVLVTGATGFIGQALATRLVARGDRVVAPSRDPEGARRGLGDGVEVLELPSDAVGWAGAASGCQAVVNLAGAPVAARWTGAHRERIRASRVELTRALVEGIGRLEPAERPRVLVSGSAVGYYGTRRDHFLGEDAPPGDDFLARICVDWEAAARPAEGSGVRVVLLRIGIVLGHGGGPLAKMTPPFRWFLGGPVAGGGQWMSWVHRDDVVGLILLALDDDRAVGPINATTPDPRRNADFSQALARAVRRPCWLPIPGFALRLAMGSGAVIVTTGQHIQPERAIELGYDFRFPTLEGAFRDLFESPRPS